LNERNSEPPNNPVTNEPVMAGSQRNRETRRASFPVHEAKLAVTVLAFVVSFLVAIF